MSEPLGKYKVTNNGIELEIGKTTITLSNTAIESMAKETGVIQAAVAEERERCAGIADGLYAGRPLGIDGDWENDNEWFYDKDVAAAIRQEPEA